MSRNLKEGSRKKVRKSIKEDKMISGGGEGRFLHCIRRESKG